MATIQRDAPIEEHTLTNLLRRAQQAKEPQAFDGLYLLYADRVFRYLVNRFHNYEIAEDVTAQVFLLLMEKITLYNIAPKDNDVIFSAWLYRVAYNKMVDALRSHQRAQHVNLDYAAGVMVNRPLEKVEERLEYETILNKLRYLNKEQRDVVVLRYVEDLSIAETATIMQKSRGAVKALQYRALENLRRYLQV